MGGSQAEENKEGGFTAGKRPNDARRGWDSYLACVVRILLGEKKKGSINKNREKLRILTRKV